MQSTHHVITSRHNQRFRDAVALRDARQRRRRGRILVDGGREIGRALAAGHEPVEAWVSGEHVRGPEARAALGALERAGVEILDVPPELLARLAYGERDEGIVVVLPTPRTDAGRIIAAPDALVAVVEGIEKPGNLGAVARSADGAGVDTLIVADPTVDPWNPNTIRASLGTIFSLRTAVCTAHEARDLLDRSGLRVVAADVTAEREWDEADLTGSVAIVLGSEAAGLSETWQGPDIERVRIPMLGLADSLNVAASAAVLFYEALRQRRTGRRRSDPASGLGETGQRGRR